MENLGVKLPLTLKQRNSIKEKLCDLESALKSILHLRNTFGDRIEIRDEILIWEGEGENKKLKFKTKGHVVNQCLIGMTSLMACGTLVANAVPSWLWGTGGTIRLGTGIGATLPATVALVAESAVLPSSVSGATSNPSVGVYRVSWIANWIAGSLAAITVTEFGLKLNLILALAVFGGAGAAPTVMSFASRISSTDGDFVAFVVNVGVPLSIEWRFTFAFV